MNGKIHLQAETNHKRSQNQKVGESYEQLFIILTWVEHLKSLETLI